MPGAICRLFGFMGQAYAAGSAPSSPAANSKAGKHPTANIEHPVTPPRVRIGRWLLDVQCWMFLSFRSRPRRATGGSRHAVKKTSRMTAPQCGLANGKHRRTADTWNVRPPSRPVATMDPQPVHKNNGD